MTQQPKQSKSSFNNDIFLMKSKSVDDSESEADISDIDDTAANPRRFSAPDPKKTPKFISQKLSETARFKLDLFLAGIRDVNLKIKCYPNQFYFDKVDILKMDVLGSRSGSMYYSVCYVLWSFRGLLKFVTCEVADEKPLIRFSWYSTNLYGNGLKGVDSVVIKASNGKVELVESNDVNKFFKSAKRVPLE